MSLEDIVKQIDAEIEVLLAAKRLLGNASPSTATAPVRKKRTISAAHRKAIIAAQKKRWAKVKAGK